MAFINQALVVVDVQNDFLPGGSLEVPESGFVVEACNELITHFKSEGAVVVATQDWHPPDHQSFASQHEDLEPMDSFKSDKIAIDTVWPDHCIQGTEGAELAAELNDDEFDEVFRKGQDKYVDSYSGFYDNEHVNSTGLSKHLTHRDVQEVYIAGLAHDVCVKYTALDSLRDDFDTFVVSEATSALTKEGQRQAISEVDKAGGETISKDKIAWRAVR